MIQVARGRLSKQIAGDIGIAEATVKVHRSRAMRKMNVRSLPELGRMADKLKLVPREAATLLNRRIGPAHASCAEAVRMCRSAVRALPYGPTMAVKSAPWSN